MQRREFISVLGGAAILAWMPLAADAQQPNKLPRLGWLPTFAATSPIYDGFRQGLRELGMSRERTSSSKLGGRKEISIASRTWPASLPVSMWT